MITSQAADALQTVAIALPSSAVAVPRISTHSTTGSPHTAVKVHPLLAPASTADATAKSKYMLVTTAALCAFVCVFACVCACYRKLCPHVCRRVRVRVCV